MYKFSVISAVYNVEKYIREAVDSLISQTIGFDSIQLILVDDGSTDSSGAICDSYSVQYPDNVIVIHKENGGSASARMAGLPYASGEYISFMDPDDTLSKESFQNVYDFFINHDDEIDVVCIPLQFFGTKSGPHPLNDKFQKGTRIVDLREEYESVLLSMASAFYKPDVLTGGLFDSALSIAEDAKDNIRILCKKMKLGVVSEATYYYRRHNESMVSNAQYKHSYYLEYLEHFSLWALRYAEKELGYLPKFVQYTVLEDLQWKLMQDSILQNVLTEEEKDKYISEIISVLSFIDDDVILSQKELPYCIKLKLIEKKYGYGAVFPFKLENEIVYGNDAAHLLYKVSETAVTLHFMRFNGDEVSVEGVVHFPEYFNENARIIILLNGAPVVADSWQCVDVNGLIKSAIDMGRNSAAFKSSFCIEDKCSYNIQIAIQTAQGISILNCLEFGTFFPLSSKIKNLTYRSGNWLLSSNDNNLLITRADLFSRFSHEVKALNEIWHSHLLGAKKAVAARIAFRLLRPFAIKPIWIVSDRLECAGDNGEAFFKYMSEKHNKEVCLFFAVKKSSSDYMKMKKYGRVIPAYSFRHKLLHLLCEYEISSQLLNMFGIVNDFYKDILPYKKNVFLQHGVIKDDLSVYTGRYKNNLFGFVTSGLPEWESIVKGRYGYSSNEIWLTGLPRFDALSSSSEKIITVMPTWRKYLVSDPDMNTGKRKLIPGFRESDFFNAYSNLLNDVRLLAAVKSAGYKLRLMLHPNMSAAAKIFQSPDLLIEDDVRYAKVFSDSSLVITDYSSTVFDFTYLRKPVLYFQFDREEFFSGAHNYEKGYFDYERDGFGEVEYTLESIVDRIIEYIDSGCVMKEKYRSRADSFFAFHDSNCCERVYSKLIEGRTR